MSGLGERHCGRPADAGIGRGDDGGRRREVFCTHAPECAPPTPPAPGLARTSRTGTDEGWVFLRSSSMSTARSSTSNYLHVDAWLRAFAELGEPADAWRIHRSIGQDSSRLVRSVVGDRDDAWLERAKDLHSRYYRELAPRLRAFSKTAELLRASYSGRGVTVVLATSAPDDELQLLRRDDRCRRRDHRGDVGRRHRGREAGSGHPGSGARPRRRRVPLSGGADGGRFGLGPEGGGAGAHPVDRHAERRRRAGGTA